MQLDKKNTKCFGRSTKGNANEEPIVHIKEETIQVKRRLKVNNKHIPKKKQGGKQI